MISPSTRREKILIMGPPKVGKSTAPLSVAKKAAEAGDTRKFWFLDTDDAIGVLLEDPQYKDVNIELFEAIDWNEYEEFGEKVMQHAQPGDFIVIDMVDKAWREVQTEERRRTNKPDRLTSMTDAVKKGKTGWELYRDVNWNLCNELYNAFFQPIMLRSKANVILVTEEKEMGDADDKQKKLMFKGGKKPAGQKSLAYQVRTILRLDRLNRGRMIDTIGDRARPELDGVLYEDFAQTYLIDTAGWRVE